MSPSTNPRFQLRRLTSIEWIIVDLSRAQDDPRCTVARVYQIDDLEYDVVWLRDLNLPTSYMSPQDVLRDVRRVTVAPRPGPRRPIPIPRLPPLPERVPA